MMTIETKEALDLGLKATGLIATAAFSLYQARNLLPGARSRLKTDLEILKLLDPTNPAYGALKAQTDRALDQLYGSHTGRARAPVVHSWPTLIVGAVMGVGFLAWTIYIVRNGFQWWAVATGVLALTGLGNLLGAIEQSQPGPSGTKPVR